VQAATKLDLLDKCKRKHKGWFISCVRFQDLGSQLWLRLEVVCIFLHTSRGIKIEETSRCGLRAVPYRQH
jgi:hypothetical protein